MPTSRDFTLSHERVDAAGLVYLGGPKDVDEGLADSAVTPGAVLTQGTNENDVAESTADGETAAVGVALENDFEGTDPEDQSDTGDADADHPWLSDFADGDPVDYANNVGVKFRGLLDSGSNNVSKGDRLTTFGSTGADGSLAHVDNVTTTDDSVLFQALEDVDSPTSGTTRIAVERVA